jgi:hypothetical protein
MLRWQGGFLHERVFGLVGCRSFFVVFRRWVSVFLFVCLIIAII